MAKTRTWTKKRHRFFTAIIGFFFAPFVRLKYHVSIQPFREQNGRQYLVLSNHQTSYDQFFIALAFKGPIYYLASEDLFSRGLLSRLISFLVAPIPIKKQTADIKAMVNCLKVAREGGTIALFPEGNRTFSGRTEYMSPSICSLIKKLGLPVAFFRIEGGYGAHPRWSDVVRRGPMKARVATVLEPEEYASLSDEELYETVKRELFVDEAAYGEKYRSKHAAEYIERMLYICPECGLTTFESYGRSFSCTNCGLSACYRSNTEIDGVTHILPFRFAADWYDYQKEYINALSSEELEKAVHYTEYVKIYEVIPAKRKILLQSDTPLHFTFDGIRLPEVNLAFLFSEATNITVLSRNKLNIYYEGDLFQVRGMDPGFNALKYVHVFNRFKNLQKGDPHAKFLGL